MKIIWNYIRYEHEPHYSGLMLFSSFNTTRTFRLQLLCSFITYLEPCSLVHASEFNSPRISSAITSRALLWHVVFVETVFTPLLPLKYIHFWYIKTILLINTCNSTRYRLLTPYETHQHTCRLLPRVCTTNSSTIDSNIVYSRLPAIWLQGIYFRLWTQPAVALVSAAVRPSSLIQSILMHKLHITNTNGPKKLTTVISRLLQSMKSQPNILKIRFCVSYNKLLPQLQYELNQMWDMKFLTAVTITFGVVTPCRKSNAVPQWPCCNKR